MAYEYIRTEQAGRVRRLILNRPQARNAQSRRLTEELDDAFQGGDLGTGSTRWGRATICRASAPAGTWCGAPACAGRYGRAYDLNVREPALAEPAEADDRGGAGLLHFRRVGDRLRLRHHLRGG
jgi:hypothetical protein